MTEWNEKSISNEEADHFIELLLEDIDFLDNFDNETIEPLNEFTSYPDQHHIIAVTSKRRRYNRTQTNHPPIMPPQRYQHIAIPRIVKNDIRRKYLLMYENVMNSYDYQLINSFFHQFMVHDVEFEKKYDKRNNFPPAKLLCGVTALVEHVLLLLQVSPDMVTRTSEIQLKQSSRDLQRAEITCRLTCHHSNLYEAHPNEFTKLINDDPVLGPLRSKGGYDRNLSVLRKRKSHDSLHQTLFDLSQWNILTFEISTNRESYTMRLWRIFIISRKSRQADRTFDGVTISCSTFGWDVILPTLALGEYWRAM